MPTSKRSGARTKAARSTKAASSGVLPTLGRCGRSMPRRSGCGGLDSPATWRSPSRPSGVRARSRGSRRKPSCPISTSACSTNPSGLPEGRQEPRPALRVGEGRIAPGAPQHFLEIAIREEIAAAVTRAATPPAQPRRPEQKQLLALLRAEEIDITLSDEDQLDPEQSTLTIVVDDPQAKYFSV